MQPTTAALGDAPQAPRRFELATFRLGAERDTDYATEPPRQNCSNILKNILHFVALALKICGSLDGADKIWLHLIEKEIT